jgi:hypothetical protein
MKNKKQNFEFLVLPYEVGEVARVKRETEGSHGIGSTTESCRTPRRKRRPPT